MLNFPKDTLHFRTQTIKIASPHLITARGQASDQPLSGLWVPSQEKNYFEGSRLFQEQKHVSQISPLCDLNRGCCCLAPRPCFAFCPLYKPGIKLPINSLHPDVLPSLLLFLLFKEELCCFLLLMQNNPSLYCTGSVRIPGEKRIPLTQFTCRDCNKETIYRGVGRVKRINEGCWGTQRLAPSSPLGLKGRGQEMAFNTRAQQEGRGCSMEGKKYSNLFGLLPKLCCLCLPLAELYQKPVDEGEWMKQHAGSQSPRAQSGWRRAEYVSEWGSIRGQTA